MLEKGETANPNGRPRKLISQVNKDLEEAGITPATPQQIKDIYLRLINMTIPEIEERVKDLKQPALVRIVGKQILSNKGYEVIERMFDRAIGKPNQSIDLTADVMSAKKTVADLFPPEIIEKVKNES